MLMGIIGFLILLLVGLFFGTITYPTRDELILIASCAGLFIMTWLNQRDKKAMQEEETLKKENKIGRRSKVSG